MASLNIELNDKEQYGQKNRIERFGGGLGRVVSTSISGGTQSKYKVYKKCHGSADTFRGTLSIHKS